MSEMWVDPVEEIRRILSDQYDPSSILKELIQNADDAGARQLHLAWMPGWTDSRHPLLRDPAFLVCNDSEFKPEDRESIPIIGRGAKGGDVSSTGKFGLGLKSVFHFCEAFFYLASPDQPASSGETVCEFINPWPSKNGVHNDWNDFETEKPLLIERVQSWQPVQGRWFCLWFPLRTEQQLDGKKPLYTGSRPFPNREDVFPQDMALRAGALLPFTRQLEEVLLWNWDGGNGSPFLQQRICVSEGSYRRYPDLEKMDTDRSRLLRGVVKAEREGKELFQLRYAGCEIRLNNSVFEKMKQNKTWPVRSYTGKNGESIQNPEKAEPHAAVIFYTTPPDRNARLQIYPAVFLPLAKPEEEPIPCSGDQDYTLALHGFYFLDAGRTVIRTSGVGEVEAGNVQVQWNQRLQKEGTFPLVLPALEAFVQEAQLSEEQIRALTAALAKSRLFQTHRDTLCREWKWVRCLQSEGVEWRLLAAQEEIRVVPAPPEKALDLPFKVFPELGRLALEFPITCREWESLTATPPALWTQDRRWMTNLDLASVFKDPSASDYLLKFLEQERSHLKEEDWVRLLDQIRIAIASIGLSQLLKHKEKFQRLIGFLLEERWVSLPSNLFEKMGGDPAYASLLQQKMQSLPLPKDLAPNEKGGEFSPSDAEVLLRWLDSQGREFAKDKQGVLTDFALSVLEKTQGDVLEKRRYCGSCRLFRVYNLRDGRHLEVSWDSLEWLSSKKALVRAGEGIARQLLSAAPELRLYSLVKDEESSILKTLFEPDSNPALPCDEAYCLKVLKQRPKLSADPKDREKLLKRLAEEAEEGDDSEAWKAVRYLLHGVAARYDDLHSPLYSTDIKDLSSIWGRLAEKILQRSGEGWRFIPSELTQQLNPIAWRRFQIRHINPSSVEELLREKGMDAIAEIAPALSDEERLEVLREIKDERIWKRLPLHRTINRTLTTLEGKWVFLVPGATHIPEEIADSVIAISMPDDRNLIGRYSNALRKWSAEATIQVALAQPEPSRLARVIMDALEEAENKRVQLDDQTREALYETSWLPTTNGSRPPSDVVYLPELDEELARLVNDPQIAGAFIETGMISDEVRSHTAFTVLCRDVLPDQQESLENLALCLEKATDYHIGQVALSHEQMETLLPGLPADLLPGVRILKSLRESVSDEAADVILPGLQKEISCEKHRRVLVALKEKHEKAFATKKREYIQAFNLYLRAYVERKEFQHEDLRGLTLLNQGKNWKEAERLCLGGAGLSPDDLLDEEQRKILENVRIPNPNSPVSMKDETDDIPQRDRSNTDGFQRLKAYFMRWESHIPETVLGGFLALLGDVPPDLPVLAGRYLTPRSLKSVREELEWVPNRAPGSGTDIHEDMRKIRFRFSVMNPKEQRTVRVMNLLGEPFDASIGESFSHLLIQEDRSFSLETWNRTGAYALTFREIDPGDFTPDQLADLLINTASLILDKAFYQTPSNLGDWLKGLSDTGQFDLARTRAKILHHAFFYFRQLSQESLTPLKELSKEWKALYDREVESESSPNRQRDLQDIQDRRKALRDRLAALLEGYPEIQEALLDAVRGKVEDYQYTPSSVPFELFQNADNAFVELAEMQGDASRSQVDRFVLASLDDRIQIVHWGRPINVFRMGSFSEEEGRYRGYHDDLAKMLLLQTSDKSLQGERVTGKFGLGFKSVFLVTDSPVILSGSLGFVVIAGMFPGAIGEEARQRLYEAAKGLSSDQRFPTVIELPFGADDAGMASCTEEFRLLAPILPCFSRRIRRVLLKEASEETEHVWEPEEVADGAWIGTLRLNGSEGYALQLKGEGNGSLLMRLGPRGVERFEDHIPTLWVTAPTDEKHGAGFLINGAFQPDVGRRQLPAQSPHNDQEAARLGEMIGNALISLFDASQDWQPFRQRLRLSADTDPVSFWTSLFELYTDQKTVPENRDAAACLLRSMLWEGKRGMARLLARRAALPTGLMGEYGCLAQVSDISFYTEGALDDLQTDDLQTFELVSRWTEFQDIAIPGAVVSKSRVWERLKGLLDAHALPEASSIHLTGVLKKVAPSGEVSPQIASRLGTVVHPEFVKRVEKKESGLTEFLNALKFMAQDESYHPAAELVDTGQSDEDLTEESLHAGFAPDSHRLHKDYREEALHFFLSSRGDGEVSEEMLARWGDESVNDPKRYQAFLKYLARDKWKDGIGKPIDAKTRDRIKTDLQDENTDIGLTQEERTKVAAALGIPLNEINQRSSQGPSKPSKPVRPIDPKKALEKVWEWWQQGKDRLLKEYEKKVYPDNLTIFPYLREPYRSEPEQRKAWFTLLLRSALETMGRTNDGQHREFLSIWERNGWLEEITHNNNTGARLVEQVEKFLDRHDQEGSYLHWLRTYMPVAAYLRWLDEYIRAFLSMNHSDGNVSLTHVLHPRTHQAFSGAIDAPSIAGALGIGAHFMLRELARARVIANSDVYPYAYVPVKRVRTVVASLGGPELNGTDNREIQSRAIHKFLCEHLGEERAIFDHTFDIPLQMLADDRDRVQLVIQQDIDWDNMDNEETPIVRTSYREDEG